MVCSRAPGPRPAIRWSSPKPVATNGDGQADELQAQVHLGEQGYEGDACGSFTLVRNGSCLKCVSCGGTSGCS